MEEISSHKYIKELNHFRFLEERMEMLGITAEWMASELKMGTIDFLKLMILPSLPLSVCARIESVMHHSAKKIETFHFEIDNLKQTIQQIEKCFKVEAIWFGSFLDKSMFFASYWPSQRLFNLYLNKKEQMLPTAVETSILNESLIFQATYRHDFKYPEKFID